MKYSVEHTENMDGCHPTDNKKRPPETWDIILSEERKRKCKLQVK